MNSHNSSENSPSYTTYRYMAKRLYLFLLLILPLALFGQSSELLGSIKDSRGALVPNAVIELRNQRTGTRLTSRSDSRGQFLFRELKSGVYQATVQAAGYKTLTRDGIHLGSEERAQLELTVEPNRGSH